MSTPAVYFAPGPDIEGIVCLAIGKATKSIKVALYTITSRPILAALKAAHYRGVDVQLIVDAAQEKMYHVVSNDLSSAGIAVFTDAEHPIFHNKFYIFDGKRVITGSANATLEAKSNAENMLVVNSPALADRYLVNWNLHRRHSTPIVAPNTPPLTYPDSGRSGKRPTRRKRN